MLRQRPWAMSEHAQSSKELEVPGAASSLAEVLAALAAGWASTRALQRSSPPLQVQWVPLLQRPRHPASRPAKRAHRPAARSRPSMLLRYEVEVEGRAGCSSCSMLVLLVLLMLLHHLHLHGPPKYPCDPGFLGLCREVIVPQTHLGIHVFPLDDR